ncbi:MAG: glycerophosphodiester phosphodiesterase [Vicinamibacterales bacterium]
MTRALPPVFQSSRPLVFAHRGGAKLAPENTMAAFDNGIALGADGMEMDVQLSGDGVPMVIHDAALDRTTDRVGPVSSLSAEELARVDAGYRFSNGDTHPFRGQGIGVPTLRAALRRFPLTRVIIEMKGAQPELPQAVARVIRETGAVDRVCVGSFAHRLLDTLRRESPEITTSASLPEARWTLHRSWVRWPFRGRRGFVAFQVPERAGRLRVVTPRFIRQVHREGRVVQVWVVDLEQDARRLLAWGVDGLISDRPDITVGVRNAWVTERGDTMSAAVKHR